MNSKVIFIVAFLAVVSGIYGVVDILFLTTEKVDVPAQVAAVKEERYVTFWRAKQSLIKGESLVVSMVQREQVLLSEALALGIKQDVTLDFQPSTLMNTQVNAGELVFVEYQTGKEQAGYLDLLIIDGMTLYPLTISSKNLISGYIKPGDSIDILAISSPNMNLSNTTNELEIFAGVTASLLLEKVRVMSVNKNDSDIINPRMSSDGNSELTIVIEVKPDDLGRLALAQRTMYLEIVRSQTYLQPPYADVSDIIPNYNGVVELRGQDNSSFEGMLK
ncbi:MAG: pilus assembly protein CpaB [Moritella sp.]|uniref:RcpC/CpaB family pilus assembly protein n=1 Tax=Moritella sp. TaxID=78556 RepID=UPI001DC82DC0|nr:RcpC/CpaB family pilus assembly protein [Moritella sp.]NQZ51289.1 pilus assembly protein CpaB [Moritella sp.]